MTATRDVVWLSAEQQRVWRSWLSASAAINEHLNEELRPFGLDLGEYEILVRLSEAPERQLRMSELAASVRQSRSRLTHAVSRLEKKGIVGRTNCPFDGRGVIAHLTDPGFELLAEAAFAHVRSVRDAFVDVVDPADFEALGRAMNAVLAAED
ncbi:MarR family winged helix-turn-helix transcriptional regulator [Propionicicella superfundia]|uniref:MarR family winged helix-turn-helix transcriptional regulator n=1 Tax=Propionicicella superfundia TaxID=348582 RepID=UPI00041F4699|nr:MarR family transcriptional regulator [Propionicicella superfundia]